ncbi:MAG: hypothetical protein H0W12_11390 [Chitinophagaceae bacterium]|nr:hypothetical protein [Chitinophagaceae bacterium]
MKKYLQLLVFILNCSLAACQAVRMPVAAQYLGLGAYSIKNTDAFSFTTNQAALMQAKSLCVGLYGERRFLLAALNMYTAVIVVPTQKGNFGLQLDYFGSKNYNESQVGVAYAKHLGSRIDMGVKFNYYRFTIPAYLSATSYNFEIGAIAHLSEKLHVGLHAYNPGGSKLINTDNEKLGAAYKFGMGYDASETFSVAMEVIKEEDKPLDVNAGFRYNFLNQFFIRAGVTTGAGIGYAGVGLSWKNFRLDVAGSYQLPLGFSPGLLLIADINKKEN